MCAGFGVTFGITCVLALGSPLGSHVCWLWGHLWGHMCAGFGVTFGIICVLALGSPLGSPLGSHVCWPLGAYELVAHTVQPGMVPQYEHRLLQGLPTRLAMNYPKPLGIWYSDIGAGSTGVLFVCPSWSCEV